jgi:hypothetical protein
MSALGDDSRPTVSVVKLVEACGILLGVPPSTERSAFKAPLPSNYDNTVSLLDSNFGGYVSELGKLTSDQLSNKVANDLYAKTLEPGFDYETAVNEGGLKSRDLFNGIKLVMTSLEMDKSRIPVTKTNVLAIVNGTKSSYAALDAATHIFKHGVVTTVALVTDESVGDRRLSGMMKSHMVKDLERRCKMQYKLPDHCYHVKCETAGKVKEVSDIVVDSIAMHGADILVYGVEQNSTFGENGDGGIPQWATFSSSSKNGGVGPVVDIPVLLTKKNSRVRPLSEVFICRTWMIYTDLTDPNAMDVAFLKSLYYIRPGDSVIICAIVDPSEPSGDARNERFEMGGRAGMWVDGVDPPTSQPDCPGWNDIDSERIADQMDKLIQSAQLDGKGIIERTGAGVTLGATLARICKEEDTDFLVMRKAVHREVVVEAVQSAPCSVLMI